MNKATKIGIVIALVVVVGITVAMKQRNKTGLVVEATVETSKQVTPPAPAAGETARDVAPSVPGPGQADAAALPKLLDLGSTTCFNCRRMSAILEVLKEEYAGRMEVEFIDVREKPAEAQRHGIRLIPTQIFFDASGTELFRNEGFFSKEDILAKWKELGVDMESKPASKG